MMLSIWWSMNMQPFTPMGTRNPQVHDTILHVSGVARQRAKARSLRGSSKRQKDSEHACVPWIPLQRHKRAMWTIISAKGFLEWSSESICRVSGITKATQQITVVTSLEGQMKRQDASSEVKRFISLHCLHFF